MHSRGLLDKKRPNEDKSTESRDYQIDEGVDEDQKFDESFSVVHVDDEAP